MKMKILQLLIVCLLFLVFFLLIYRPYRVRMTCDFEAKKNFASIMPPGRDIDAEQIRKESGMSTYDYYRKLYFDDCLAKNRVK